MELTGLFLVPAIFSSLNVGYVYGNHSTFTGSVRDDHPSLPKSHNR